MFDANAYHFTGFVNAQYRFVMNPNGDYTVHFADPDMCVFLIILSVTISIKDPIVSFSGRIFSK
jgi:hypothetical protein